MKQNYFLVFVLGFSLLFSTIPVPTLAQSISSEQIATDFLASEYGQIDIVNQQSYPIQNGPWITEFVTKGNQDLIISAIDGTSFWGFNSDVSFVELYDGDTKLVPVIKNNKIIFPNFFSDGTNHLKVLVNTLGEHHLKFEFGSDVAYTNNFASASSSTKIASGTTNLPTLEDDDRFGTDVAGIGDLDKDGVEDIAVGAFLDDTNSCTDCGAIHILFMNIDRTIKSTSTIAHSTGGGPSLTVSDRFGQSVAPIGDVNNDGVVDLVAGVTQDNTGGVDTGVIYILLMTASGTASSTLQITENDPNMLPITANSRFGQSVTGIGDLDNDGVEDIAVGAHKENSDKGAVFILFLKNDGTLKNSVKITDGSSDGPSLSTSDFFGMSVTGIGDINNDGIEDIVVGANGDDTGGSANGALYVITLSTDGTVKTTGEGGLGSVKIADSTNGGPDLTGGDQFGFDVENMGDLNDDGVVDLSVATRRDDTGGTDRGAVHFLFMKADGTVNSFSKIASDTNGGPTLTDNSNIYGVANIGDLDMMVMLI